jgi:hypothetical protein
MNPPSLFLHIAYNIVMFDWYVHSCITTTMLYQQAAEGIISGAEEHRDQQEARPGVGRRATASEGPAH